MIKNKSDLEEYLAEDRKANGITSLSHAFGYTYRFIVLLRYYEFYLNTNKKIRKRLTRIFLRRLGLLTGISIGPNCFGKGLYIPHYGSIVCNSSARFGDYCVLQNGVNISQGVRGGNNIYLGAGCKVVSNVSIADYCIIGANAVLTKDAIEDNCVYAGIPAKKISNDGTKDRTNI